MTELERLHQVHLELADEFHRICVANDIPYFLVAGTLLGAVRHNGFIPWDDDFDIGMLRKDYDKLQSILADQLDDCFYCMTMHNNERYSLPFLKIMKKDSLLGEGNLPNDIKDYGIFIDVFAFDSVPTDKKLYKKHKRKTNFYKKLLLVKNNYQLNLKNPVKILISNVLKIYASFHNNEKLKLKLEKTCKQYNDESSLYITNIGGAYGYDHETIDRSYTSELVLYAFEGREYYSFKNYDAYLEAFYGDYMKLPPENQRENRHNYKYIIFNTKEVE